MQTLTLIPPARPSKSTQILIGDGAIKKLSSLIGDGYDRTLVLADEGIASIADGMCASLHNPVRIDIPKGDGSKSLAEADRIVGKMLKARCTRRTMLVCIGGGMLTDLGGFVASVFMRGIPSVLVPTTLLGMVDASIGGKNGVNAGSRKNMIGTVTHPAAVVIEMDLLKTLPEAQLKEGLVEVIKIAAMLDLPFFEWLEQNIGKILLRDVVVLEQCVARAVQAKVRVVEADEHDREERLLLNFGHTVGHAVEALSQYAVSHGAAVAIGMTAEMAMGETKEAPRVSALLRTLNIALSIPASMKPAEIWALMQSDKKNEGGEIRIAVPSNLGEGKVLSLREKEFQQLFS